MPPCVEGWPIEESGDGNGGLLEVDGRSVLQDLIPYVGQLIFPQVPVEGWVIDTDEHGLFYGPGDALGFLAYIGEAVDIHGVSCEFVVLVNWGGSSEIFL